MSARDEFPAHGAIGGTAELDDGQYEAMCDLIDGLRDEVATRTAQLATQIQYGNERFAQAREAVAAMRAVADRYESILDRPAL